MFLLPADQIEPSSLEIFDGLVDAISEIEKVRKRNMVTLNITQRSQIVKRTNINTRLKVSSGLFSIL